MAKKKKSIYSRRLKDVNKDGKRNFGDTWLGDLIGADGKIGIGEGRPGLKDSLKGDRREKPITKKPKKKPPVGKKPKRKPKLDAKPNVRVGVKTSTSVVGVKSDRHSGAGGSKSKNITDRKFDPPSVQPKRKTDKSKTVDRSKIPYADRVVEKKTNKTIPKDVRETKGNQDNRRKFISPAIQSMYDYFYPEQDSGAVQSVVKKKKKTGPSGLSRGGVIDYRTKGMFYGGSVKKGRK